MLSIRQFFALQGNWPEELPSNGGKTLVVAGLEGCLDLLTPQKRSLGWKAICKARILSISGRI